MARSSDQREDTRVAALPPGADVGSEIKKAPDNHIGPLQEVPAFIGGAGRWDARSDTVVQGKTGALSDTADPGWRPSSLFFRIVPIDPRFAPVR